MLRRNGRIALLTVLALLLALAAPALAGAAPAATPSAKPLMIKPDPYEPDDTTATAKVLPPYSVHTIDNSGSPTGGSLVPDVDMAKITADATGTPFCIEARQISGYFICRLGVADTDADGNLRTLQTGIGLWGFTYGNTLFFTAPHPGTFYVAVVPEGNFGNGVYGLSITKGLAERVSGGDRYATAAAVSQLMWPNSANAAGNMIGAIEDTSAIGPAGCVIARGNDFADALAGSAFAGRETGSTFIGMGQHLAMPVLLTQRDELPLETLLEILRLGQMRLWTHQPFTIYILGGDTAVSAEVEQELRSLDSDLVQYAQVVRVAGTNRFGTAAAIAAVEASSSAGTGDTAFLVNGFSFPDAMAAGPIAAAAHGPVLMTRTSSLPDETRAYLLAHPELDHIVVAGSSSIVATAVIDDLEAAPLSRTVERVSGGNRYQTALALAEYGVDKLGMNPEGMQVVSGDNFPDGLSAGPMSAFTGAPLLLTRPSALSTEVIGFYEEYGRGTGEPLPAYVVGGPLAVTPAAFDSLNDYWKAD